MAIDDEKLDEILTASLNGEPLDAVLADLSFQARAECELLLATLRRVREAERLGVSAAAAARQERSLLRRAAELRQAAPAATRNGVASGVPRGVVVQPPPAFWRRLGVSPLRAVPASIAAAITAIVLLVGGTMTVAASSLPDSPLYSLKLAGERMQLTLSLNQQSRARVYLLLAERRLAEADRIARANDPSAASTLEDLLVSAQANIDQALEMAKDLRGQDAVDVLSDLAGVIARERSLLEGVLPTVSSAHQPQVERVLASARENQQIVEQTLRQRVEETLPSAVATAPPPLTPTPVFTSTPIPTPTAAAEAGDTPANGRGARQLSSPSTTARDRLDQSARSGSDDSQGASPPNPPPDGDRASDPSTEQPRPPRNNRQVPAAAEPVAEAAPTQTRAPFASRQPALPQQNANADGESGDTADAGQPPQAGGGQEGGTGGAEPAGQGTDQSADTPGRGPDGNGPPGQANGQPGAGQGSGNAAAGADNPGQGNGNGPPPWSNAGGNGSGPPPGSNAGGNGNQNGGASSGGDSKSQGSSNANGSSQGGGSKSQGGSKGQGGSRGKAHS